MKIILDRYLKLSTFWQLLVLLIVLLIVGGVYGWVGSNSNFSYSGVTDKKLEEISISLSQEKVVLKEPNLGEKLTYILSRLIDPGNIEDSEDRTAALVLSVLGWMLCGGFFIAILTNGYFERIKKIENGNVRYAMKSHVVIFGNNDMTMSLIKQIRAKKWGNYKNKIVVFSSEDALTVRKKFKAFLNKKEEKNLFIYHGDRGSIDHLNELCLVKADSIYVLGDKKEESIDSRNINCIKLISDIVRNHRDFQVNRQIRCFLLLDHLNTFDLLQHSSMEENIKKALDVKSFNMHQTWATKLFSNDKVSKDQDYSKIYKQIEKLTVSKVDDYDEYVFRFVIFGFNRMGKAILNQAARVLHLGSKRKIVVTVIDKIASQHENEFKALHPGWKDIPDMSFEFIECNAISIESRELMEEWNSKNQLLAAAVCFRNPDYSLHIGLNLPREIYESKIPILLRQEELHGFTKSINDDGQYSEVIFFGMLENIIEDNHLRERIAMEIHDNYVVQNNTETEEEDKEDNKKESKKDPKNSNWFELPESFKWANRYILDDYPLKEMVLKRYSSVYSKMVQEEYLADIEALYYADIHVNDFSNTDTIDEKNAKEKRVSELEKRLDHDKLNECKNKLAELISQNRRDFIFQDLELLSEIEHNRWCGERVIAKWASAESKCAEMRLHHCLVPYANLVGEIKNYDRENVIKFLENYSKFN